MLPMLDARHDLPLCRTVAGQLISDHDARRPALPLQQLSQQALGGALITPALDQHVEYDAVLIDRAPQPVLLAGDLHHNFIQVPFVSGRRQTPPDPVGKCLAELERPLPHALMADDDAACGQHLLDHAQAEREAKVQPYGVADNLGREAVPGIAGGDRRCHPVGYATSPATASRQLDGATHTAIDGPIASVAACST